MPKKLKSKEELKARAKASKRYREKQKLKKEVAAQAVAEYKQEITLGTYKTSSDEAIRKLLIDKRGLKHPHVIDTVIEWGRMAAEANQCEADEAFWVNGFTSENPSRNAIGDEQAKGMVINTRDLFALYDFCASWREFRWPLKSFEEFRSLPWDFSSFIEKKGSRITFEEFHGLRYCNITNSLWAGRWIHGKDFQPQPHGVWADFFVPKVPTLPSDYGTEEIKAWLGQLTDGPRRFLIVASRNSYKSTWQVCSEAIPFVLACPDITILEVSAVKNLSKKFTKAFRQYWTVVDQRNPSLFNILWPEMMIFATDKSDATVFDCPMKKGLYPQNTMASTSVDSSQVGERCLLLVFDDPADEENEATPQLREGLISKIELIEKLREPAGITMFFGTPKCAVGDLYQTIIERSAKTSHRYLEYLIQPVWTLNDAAKRKNIHDVVEDDIDSFLFPSRMNFDFLKGELENGSEANFRRENLCEWVDNNDPSLLLHFSRPPLEECMIDAESVPPNGEVYITGDLGFTTTRKRDPSCFTLHKTLNDCLYILYQSTGWWNDHQKAEELIRLSRFYPNLFQKAVLEKYAANEGLDKEIKQTALIRGALLPVHWLPTDNSIEAKFRRLKHDLENAVFNRRIKFVKPKDGSNWIEELIQELLKLDGKGPKWRSSTRNDDRGDSASLAVRYFLKSDDSQSSEEIQKLKEAEAEKERAAQQYNRIFGPSSFYGVQPAIKPEDPEPEQRANQVWPKNDSSKKMLSFAYMREKPVK